MMASLSESQQPSSNSNNNTDSNSKEADPLAPLEWTMDSSTSSEDVSLALLNAVDLDQDEGDSPTSVFPRLENTTDDGGKRRRSQDEEGNAFDSAAPTNAEAAGLLIMAADERPRVSRRRKKKPKGMPKRPMNAYAIFYYQERLRIVESMNEGSISEDDIQRQVGKMWRALPDAEVNKYEKLAEEDKTRYHEEMEAYQSNGTSGSGGGGSSSKTFPKNDMRKDLEDERGNLAYDFPPPPPGVMVISGGRPGGSSGRESVSSNCSGRRDSSNSESPVPPPPLSSRWTYQPPPPAVPQMHPQAYAPLPSVSSAPSPPRTGRVIQHGGPYAEYFHHAPQAPPVPPPSWAAAPPSPYSPRSGRLPPPPLPSMSAPSSSRAYSPHLAPPPPAYSAPPPPTAYSIPPGMELALPTRSGGEQKYKVSYRCYTMRKEDLPSFMESLNASAAAPPPNASRPSPVTRSESLPPRPSSTYSSHPVPPPQPQQQPLIHHHPSW